MRSSSATEPQFDAAPDVEPPRRTRGIVVWLKRIGIVGFLFFLLKGIAWLFVLWGGARMIGCS